MKRLAGKGGHLKSLIQFSKDKKCQFGIKLSKDFFDSETIKNTNLKIDNIPLYAIEGMLKKYNLLNFYGKNSQ